nr:hypothetical protein BaRGS_018512 [Batillaria attramentaria]
MRSQHGYTSTAKIQTFSNGCLRQILHLRWFDRVLNTDLWTRANQQPKDVQVKRRKWRWVGHTLRKEPCNVTRQALEWNPQGKRKRGRPKQIDLEEELALRAARLRPDMGGGQDLRQGQSEMEESC